MLKLNEIEFNFPLRMIMKVTAVIIYESFNEIKYYSI